VPRIRLGVTRFSELLASIERQLRPDGRLTCRLGAGRVSLVVRGAGATRWAPEVQLEYALELAGGARARLAADARKSVKSHARHAVVVRYEDAGLAARDAPGDMACEVRATWECVVPAPNAR
jgi:hypothetical protein